MSAVLQPTVQGRNRSACCYRCKRTRAEATFAERASRCTDCDAKYARERRAKATQVRLDPTRLVPAFLAMCHTPGADGNAPARA